MHGYEVKNANYSLHASVLLYFSAFIGCYLIQDGEGTRDTTR
jgi:hypothetical protein